MLNFRRQVLLYIFKSFDLVLLVAALCVSVLGRALFTPLPILVAERIQVHTIFGIAVLLFLWRQTFSLLGLYQSKRLAPFLSELTDLSKASVIATILLFAVGIFFRILNITPAVVFRFLPLTLACLILSRLVLRQALKVVRLRGHNLRHVIIVGTNARALACAEAMMKRPELGYTLVGFVDDVWVGPIPDSHIEPNLVSTIAEFRSYLRSHIVDEVIIALPIKSFYDQEDELRQICQNQGVIVRVHSDLFEGPTVATDVSKLGADPLVSYYPVPSEGIELGAKRVIDLLGSVILIIFFSPFMLVALILVKIDSEGPALFSQERIGLNKRRFRLYKFRSMVPNAEKLQAQLETQNEAEGPVFKITDDPRITRVGKLLRKTSIDELPQLFNVLKGDMSLVGPRPLPVRDYTGFNHDWQRRRFSVRPGITCLWQVSGRSAISFDQWMRLDMEYIDRWSLWLDMKILVRTIPAVVKRSRGSLNTLSEEAPFMGGPASEIGHQVSRTVE